MALVPTIVSLPDPERIADAVAALQRGELVIFPTDTVYGLAAHPDFPDAMERLYKIKDRSPDKKIARLAASLDHILADGAVVTDRLRRLASAYWPGALTLVLEVNDTSIAYRIPQHPVALAVLEGVGRPLPVTSANPSGEADACTAAEAAGYFPTGVHCILDSGPTVVQVPSTIARAVGDELEILREGSLSLSKMRAIWDEKEAR